MLSWVAENTTVALMLALVAGIVTVFYRSKPALCHILWVVVLVRLLLPPIAIPGWPPRELKSVVDRAIGSAVQSPSDRRTALPPVVASAPRLAAWPDKSWPADDFYLAKSDPMGNMKSTNANSEDETPSAEASGPRKAEPAVVLGGWKRPVAKGTSDDGVEITRVHVFLGAWLLGSLCCLVSTLCRIIRFRAAVGHTVPADDHLRELAEDVAKNLGVRPPDVRAHAPTSTPAVWCLGRPVLLWPDSMAGAPDEVIRPVIAHELAHLRRRDHWTAWLEILATIVLWWNPLVWIACRQIHRQAELACDARVIAAQPDQRRRYAETLITAAAGHEFRPSRPALAAVDTDRRSFEQRVRMIMQGRMTDHVGLATVVAIVAATMLVAPSWVASGGSWWLAPEPIPASLESAIKTEKVALHADTFFRTQTWDRSADMYARIARINPADGKVHYRLGVSLLKSDRPVAALEAFALQANLGYRPEEAHFGRARSLAAMGDADESLEALHQAFGYGFIEADRISADPALSMLVQERSDMKRVKGDIQISRFRLAGAESDVIQEDWGSALSRLRNLAKLSPQSGVFHAKLGQAAMQVEDFDLAEWGFLHQDRLGFDRAEARFNLARVLAKKGVDDSDVIDALKKAVASGFDDADRISDDDAFKLLRQRFEFEAIVRDAGEPARLRRLIDEEMSLGAFSAVISAADKLLTFSDRLDDIQEGWARHRKGLALLGLGETSEADAEFVEQVRLGYWVTEGLYRIACCRAAEGEHLEALAYLEGAVDAGMYGLAQSAHYPMLAELSQYPQFVDIVSRSKDNRVRLVTFNAADWQHLKERGLAEIRENGESYKGLVMLGWAQLKLGEYEDGAETFKKQVALGQGRGIPEYNVACAYSLMNQRENALDWLEKSAIAGGFRAEHARTDSDLANLRGEPRFNRLLSGLRGAE